MKLLLKFLFCYFTISSAWAETVTPIAQKGEFSCKPENQCGELCCADTDCCSSEGHCCKECIDTEACLKAGNILENIDGCYVCKENPNACKKECKKTGMTGAKTTKCDCICDIRLGFKPLAVNEECVCRDGFHRLIHEDRCVECFTNNDCNGDCMVCSAENTCVPGPCCKKENMRCGTNDRCCGDLSCSSKGFCCPYPEIKKCPKHQGLVIPPDKCPYCEDLPPEKVKEEKAEVKQERTEPLYAKPVEPSWKCRDALLKESGITYSGKHIIPTDHLIFFFFDKEGDKLIFSYLDTGPSLGITTHGISHWNTHDSEKSHVLKEITLPHRYCVDVDSVKGTSYGSGCKTLDFSGIQKSVAVCYYPHVQKPTVEWEFTIYPLKD